MNRQAFKQRMQKYKAYKEQNPDARYLQWKEALPKNLQDDTSYNLRRAYELDYEPITVEGDTLKHLPTRDWKTGEILKKPWHPTYTIGLMEDARLGYYPKVVDGTTYTTTWEGNENSIFKYEDGGEVGGKKEPPYPSFYNGRRVNRWAGEPLATGALKPAVDLEDFANLTPVGDAITVNEMGNAAAKKDWSGLGWASLGLLPIVGSKGSKVIKAAVKGAERTAASTISREVPKVNKSSVQKEMDRLLQQREMYKAIEGDDYFILDPSDAVNARNRVIKSIDDRTIKRAKKVDKKYGTNYAGSYKKLLEDYQNMNQVDVRMDDRLSRERAGAKAKLALDEEYSIGRADTDPVDDYRRYAISLNADEVPTQAHVRHELGHLTDIMQNDGMLHTDIDNNKLLQELSDPNQLVTYKDFSSLAKNMDPFTYFSYLRKGTEIKSFMNQTRQALMKRGKLRNSADHANEKVIAEYMNSLPDGMGEKMVYQSFKDPKTYRRWFNSIPTVGFIGAAYTGNKLLNRGDDNGQYIPNISDTNL